MDKISAMIQQKKLAKQKKLKQLQRWQELSVSIVEDLKIPEEERSLIFKLCKSEKIIYADYAFLLKNKIFGKSAIRYLLAITKKI